MVKYKNYNRFTGVLHMDTHRYFCKICDFRSNVFRDYHRHMNTAKHARMVKYNIYTKYYSDQCGKAISEFPETAREDAVAPEVHKCVCGKAYKHAASLYNHKKKCELAQMDLAMKEKIRVLKAKEIELKNLVEMKLIGAECSSKLKELQQTNVVLAAEEIAPLFQEVVPLLKEGGEEVGGGGGGGANEVISILQNQSDELKKIVDATEKIKRELSEVKTQGPAKIVNNINTVNAIGAINNFNIVGFLNKECGHAVSLEDFLKGMELSMDDIYYTRDNGYVKGMSNAFIKQIETMGYNNRPIHCTDKKRLKFFIKTKDGGWMRDNDNSNLEEAVSMIKTKHIEKLEEWKRDHPGWLSDPKESEEYLLMCNNFMEDAKDNGDKKKTALLRAIGAATILKNGEEGGGDDEDDRGIQVTIKEAK